MVIGVFRLLLAISVVIFHFNGANICGFSMINGTVAIKSFFIISGFYMAFIINEKYKSSYRLFITNRILRLYPAYFVVLFIIILMSIIYYYTNGYGIFLTPYIQYWNILDISTKIVMAFTNLFIIGLDLFSFLGLNLQNGSLYYLGDMDLLLQEFVLIGQAWALSTELFFYAFAPLIVNKNYKILVVVILISFLSKFLLFNYGYIDYPWKYRSILSNLEFFLAGILSYKLYKKIGQNPPDKKVLYLVSGLVLIYLFTYNAIPDYLLFGLKIKEWCFYALLAFSVPYMFINSKNSRTDRKIGELSYPVYLSHVMILNLFGMFIDSHVYPELPKALAIIGTLAFAYALFKLVIEPIDRIRQARIARSAPAEKK